MLSAPETVGVRLLKARLSEYLKRVQDGARLTVTDRGRPVATLAPVGAPASVAWAHSMAAEGRVGWSGGKPAGRRPRVKARRASASSVVLDARR